MHVSPVQNLELALVDPLASENGQDRVLILPWPGLALRLQTRAERLGGGATYAYAYVV